NPDANIYIFDSKSAGGEIDLLIFKAIELIKEGLGFHEVVAGLNDYHEKTHAGYMLKSVDNLVKNGRVNKIVGSLVGLLNIHVIGIRSEAGNNEKANTERGSRTGPEQFCKGFGEKGFSGKGVQIPPGNNEPTSQKLIEKNSRTVSKNRDSNSANQR